MTITPQEADTRRRAYLAASAPLVAAMVDLLIYRTTRLVFNHGTLVATEDMWQSTEAAELYGGYQGLLHYLQTVFTKEDSL